MILRIVSCIFLNFLVMSYLESTSLISNQLLAILISLIDTSKDLLSMPKPLPHDYIHGKNYVTVIYKALRY